MQRIWKRRSELNDRRRTNIEVRRATPQSRGYDAAWNKLAKRRRRADKWLYQPCLATGKLTATNEVDHIIPIHIRPDWRLEYLNTQVICRCCHRRKTLDDAKRYGSSEAQHVSDAQHQARCEAMLLKHAPRRAA